MTVDEHAKVIRFTGKHSPDQFSIFDFHALRSPVVQKLLQVSDELYSSSGGKFRVLPDFGRSDPRSDISFDGSASGKQGGLRPVQRAG